MPATRIVPTFRAKGLLPAAAAIGLIYGVALVPIAEFVERHISPRTTPEVWIISLMLTICILPIAFLTIWCAQLTRRIRPPLLAGILIALGMFMGAFAYGQLSEQFAGALHPSFEWQMLIPFAIALALGALVALLFRWLTLQLICPVEQSGLLCWRCGYDYGSPSITLCPECAEPPDFGRFRRRWISRLWCLLMRAAPCLLLLVILIGGGWGIHRIATVRWPAQRFINRVGPRGQQPMQWAYFHKDSNFGFLSWDGLFVQQEVVDDPEHVIGYAYWTHAPANSNGSVHMRIFLGAPRTTTYTFQSIGGPAEIRTMPVQPNEGTLRIGADLDADQAEQVIRAGRAPDSLIRALLDAAEKHNWQPNAATTWGPSYSAEELNINPQEYFEPAPAPQVQQDGSKGR